MFITKVPESGFIVDAPRRQQARTVRTLENIEDVAINVIDFKH